VPDHDGSPTRSADLGAGRFEFISTSGFNTYSARLLSAALLAGTVHMGGPRVEHRFLALLALGLTRFSDPVAGANEYG